MFSTGCDVIFCWMIQIHKKSPRALESLAPPAQKRLPQFLGRHCLHFIQHLHSQDKDTVEIVEYSVFFLSSNSTWKAFDIKSASAKVFVFCFVYFAVECCHARPTREFPRGPQTNANARLKGTRSSGIAIVWKENGGKWYGRLGWNRVSVATF